MRRRVWDEATRVREEREAVGVAGPDSHRLTVVAEERTNAIRASFLPGFIVCVTT